MAYMLLFIDRKGAPAAPPGASAELSALARDLERQGKLLRAGALAPAAQGVRVVVQGGEARVSEGADADRHETIGGFWILDAASREEAIEIARRAFACGAPQPDARRGCIDVHVLGTRYSVRPDPGGGTPYLLGFHNDAFLTDPGLAKMDAMIAFGAALEREGKLFETTPLAREGPPARVESRDGKTLVTEGPFAEAKEVIGGFSLLRVASRAEAIEIATRYPAARWGTVEVREMVERE